MVSTLSISAVQIGSAATCRKAREGVNGVKGRVAEAPLKRSLMTTLPAAVPNMALATSARREGAIATLEVVTTLSAMGRLASDELTELFRRHQGTDTTAMAGF